MSGASPPVLSSGRRLLGRGRECEVLDRLLDTVSTGNGGVWEMHGEAGDGKTALLASARILAFVARRLVAEEIALVFATRELGETLSGLPALPVAPLQRKDARALLESVLPTRVDERVLERIIAETRGNPLALLELPR